MPCRRGHSDKWRRYRRNGTYYCRRCQTRLQDYRRHGLSMAPLASQRKRLKRDEFDLHCYMIGKRKMMVIELAGHNPECLGNYYRTGAGPEVRKDICSVLRVAEDRIWE